MDQIIEYVDVKYDVDQLKSIFKDLKRTAYSTFTECDISSWLICSHPRYEEIMKPILDLHKQVHPHICPLATGLVSDSPRPPDLDASSHLCPVQNLNILFVVS